MSFQWPRQKDMLANFFRVSLSWSLELAAMENWAQLICLYAIYIRPCRLWPVAKRNGLNYAVRLTKLYTRHAMMTNDKL